MICLEYGNRSTYLPQTLWESLAMNCEIFLVLLPRVLKEA